jgi:predicted DNA-binding transcriptional regulator AlpA
MPTTGHNLARLCPYRLVQQGFLPRPVSFGPATVRWALAEFEELERRLGRLEEVPHHESQRV